MTRSDQHDRFLPKDKELRARVRLFGELLGNVIHDLEGQAVFDAVEKLRRGFVSLRKDEDPDLRRQLMADITHFDASLTERVIRAFSIYFSLVNIAEEDLFYRWRRAQVSSGEPLWTGSFDQTLRELHGEGVTAEELERLLNELHYQPVFTAHPTEARRRTTMENQRRVFETADRLNQPGLGEEERRLITEELETQIQILWRTNEVRVKKPQVQDEIKYGLFYFEESLFEAIPQSYRFLEKAIRRIYGVNPDGSLPVRIPAFLHFGSWIGGDRDGNPNVTPEVTELSCRLAMEQVLREYLKRVNHLRNVLTHSSFMCQPSQAFLAMLQWLLQAGYLGGGTIASAMDPMLLGIVFEGAQGTRLILAVTGLLLVQAILLDARRLPGVGYGLSLAGVLLVMFAFVQVGHTVGEPRFLLAGLLIVHLLAAAFWVASLAPLYRLAGHPPEAADAARILARFGQVAMIGVGLLVLAGLVLAWWLLGGITPLLTTGYGQFLIGKVLIVALLLLLRPRTSGGWYRPSSAAKREHRGVCGAALRWRAPWWR